MRGGPEAGKGHSRANADHGLKGGGGTVKQQQSVEFD